MRSPTLFDPLAHADERTRHAHALAGIALRNGSLLTVRIELIAALRAAVARNALPVQPGDRA